MEKKRNPVLLNTLLASLPMFRYSRPIRTPIHKCDITLRWGNTWTHSYKSSNMYCMMVTIIRIWIIWIILSCCKTEIILRSLTVSLHIVTKLLLKRMQNCVSVLVAKVCFSMGPESCANRRQHMWGTQVQWTGWHCKFNSECMWHSHCSSEMGRTMWDHSCHYSSSCHSLNTCHPALPRRAQDSNPHTLLMPPQLL